MCLYIGLVPDGFEAVPLNILPNIIAFSFFFGILLWQQRRIYVAGPNIIETRLLYFSIQSIIKTRPSSFRSNGIPTLGWSLANVMA